MSRDLFISYSHLDKQFVGNLCGELDARQISYFLDEKDIEWGSSIREKATSGLQDAAALLLVMSPGSSKSTWVPFEAGYAQGCGRLVLPLAAYPGVDAPTFLGDAKYLKSTEEALAYFSSDVWARRIRYSRATSNDRGRKLPNATEEIGLVDIENRQNDKNILPPSAFYERARTQIVLTAITAFRTIDQDHAILSSALQRGVDLRLLIMAPDSPEIPQLEAIHYLAIKSQIEDVVDRIRRLGFSKNPRFQVRFLQKSPRFTAVMLDGDVDSAVSPKDEYGQIRVQSGTSHKTQHNGLVLQFAKVRNGDGFELFASDVRSQWQRDGQQRDDLLLNS